MRQGGVENVLSITLLQPRETGTFGFVVAVFCVFPLRGGGGGGGGVQFRQRAGGYTTLGLTFTPTRCVGGVFLKHVMTCTCTCRYARVVSRNGAALAKEDGLAELGDLGCGAGLGDEPPHRRGAGGNPVWP